MVKQDCDLKAKIYNVAWFASHPGYSAEKSKEWRAANPNRTNLGRLSKIYRDLENWRRRCQRSGVVPPKESYWRNRRSA
jgi:hypothetical protein